MLPPSQGEPLGDGALQAANASARAVLHHPHPARYVGALSLCVARTRDSRGEQLAARSREPASARRISRDASNSQRLTAQELQHLGLAAICHSKNVLAGVPRETSQKLVGRNFLDVNLNALNRGPAGPAPQPISILGQLVKRGAAASSERGGCASRTLLERYPERARHCRPDWPARCAATAANPPEAPGPSS